MENHHTIARVEIRVPLHRRRQHAEVSWPKIRGTECEPVAIFFKSVPQIPQVCTRNSNSPAPICGTATVSKRTSFTPR